MAEEKAVGTIEISAKKEIVKDDPSSVKTATIIYDFGKDLNEMVGKFTDDVVFTNARASFKITAQSAMRRYLSSGLGQEEVAGKMAAWKPGVAIERTVDPVAALLGKWGSMSKEEQADVLKKLKAK